MTSLTLYERIQSVFALACFIALCLLLVVAPYWALGGLGVLWLLTPSWGARPRKRGSRVQGPR